MASRLDYFADLRSYLEDLSDSAKAESDLVANELINRIDSLNPNYFDSFNSKIQSRNYAFVDSAISQGVNMLIAAISLSPSYSSFFMRADSSASNINPRNYDFTTSEGVNQYLVDVSNRVTNSNDYMIDPNQKACLFLAVAVAVFIWNYIAGVNALAAVNAVALINFAALFIAVAAVYAKVAAWGPKSKTIETSTFDKESLVSEVASKF